MSTATAEKYVQRMVQREARGPGDIENAMRRLETRYGIGFWQMSHLRKGNAKTCDLGLFARIHAAYLDMCAKQVGNLLHEMQSEAAAGHDDLADLEAEAVRLAAKIAAKKASLATSTN